MSKFHVNPENGVVGACAANKRRCPLGDENVHFTSESDAQQYAEKILAERHPEASLSKKRGKLIIYSGLPGSGKSTLGDKLAAETGGLVVNRDDQRTEMFGEAYHRRNPDPKSEAAVTAILKNRTLKALREGRTVIDTNTNLNPRFLAPLVAEARKLGADVQFISVDVPIEVAKERNRKRGESGGRLVPEHVIDSMASKAYDENGRIKDVVVSSKGFVFMVSKETPGMRTIADYNKRQTVLNPITSKNAIIVDIDGTLCVNQEFADKYIRQTNQKKDFNAFYENSVNAPVNQDVVALTKKLREQGYTVIALTGRTDDYAEQTIAFLERTGAPISKLYMARAGDYRGDSDTKIDNVSSIENEGFSIIHAIDDRPRSIEIWHRKNVLVSTVIHGEHPQYPTDGSNPPLTSLVAEGFCVKCGDTLEKGFLHEQCDADLNGV